MPGETHKWLDIIQHLSWYISGFFIVLIGAWRLFWHQHKSKERRINNLEILAENMATKDDLQSCSEDKNQRDNANLNAVLAKLDAESEKNHEAHAEIIAKSHASHKELLNTIVSLHTK